VGATRVRWDGVHEVTGGVFGVVPDAQHRPLFAELSDVGQDCRVAWEDKQIPAANAGLEVP
jgi:hypothetical protein